MATWNKTWTSFANINNNNQFSDGDVLTASLLNPAYNNINYLKDDLDTYKAKKVSSWSSTTSNDNYPSEKLVKDSLNTINNTITTFRNSTNISINSINKKLYNSNNDEDYYSYVENPDNGFGFTIVSVNEFDGFKTETQFSCEDVTMRYYEGNDFHFVKLISLGGLDADIKGLDADIDELEQSINSLNNKLNGDNIYAVDSSDGATYSAIPISSVGVYLVSFYLSNLQTVVYTAVLSIYSLNQNYAVTLPTGTLGNTKNVEIFYNKTSRKITASIESGMPNVTVVLGACFKIATFRTR